MRDIYVVGKKVTKNGCKMAKLISCHFFYWPVFTVVKPNLVPPKGISFPSNSGLVLTQLTTLGDWQAVQEFSWGWHWSTFKNIGC